MLELVRNPVAYFEAPARRVFRGRRFICAQSQGGVYGLVAWGRIVEEDAHELIEVLDAAANAEQPRRQIVDLRAVRHVAGGAMKELSRYYLATPPYVRTVSHEAVVRPDGLVGILAEGMYRVVPLPFEGRVFCFLDEAFRWLGDEQGWSSETQTILDQGGDALEPMVRRLRRVVAEHGAALSVAGAAKHCAMSPRSFQRRLRSIETTWPRLRRSLLVEEAQARMLEGETDLKVLAHGLGFRSQARFSEAFRLVAGLSPSAWLERESRL